jgi:hypothetical protein
MIEVECQRCGRFFEAADSLAGGLTNCPACGKATAVPGLRDTYFRVIQVGMAVAWAFLTAIGWSTGGWVGALAFGVGAALVMALLYVAL